MRTSLVLACACIAAAPLWASAADAPKPLRTLVYRVAFSASNRNEEQTSGFTGVGGGTGTGGGMVSRSGSVADDGTLTVDVVAATADGGLVVDAAFAGTNVEQAPARVAIFADGRLSYRPGLELAPEAAYVLPLLARGMIAERQIDVNASWTSPVPAPGSGTATYRVTAVADDQATLEITRTVTVGGGRGFDETDRGTVVYDTTHLDPRSFDLTAVLRHTVSSQYVTSTQRITANLVSDSFVKKG